MLNNLTRHQVESLGGQLISEDENTLLVSVLGGAFSLYLNKNDVSLTPSISTLFYWEPWITAWFTNHIEEGDFVVDIGANCGYFTMLFEKLTGKAGMVLAYEPSSYYVDLLERTKQHNNANFIVENSAVSDSFGTLTLTYPGEYTGSASVVGSPFDAKWGEEHYEAVNATTLDHDFEGMSSPQIIKIDAESAEQLIWNGAHALLSRHDAPVVVLEYSPTGTYSEDFPDRLFAYGEVTNISTDGNEEVITPQYLRDLTDWSMIVIRKR